MADWAITEWNAKAVFTASTEDNFVAMKKAAILVESYVKKSFQKQGTGRSRKVTKSGKRHFASLPGETPAIDTGTLRASIMHEVTRSGLGINGKVGVESGVKYGRYLELGTRTIAPRPFLRPAVAASGNKINEIFRKANSA